MLNELKEVIASETKDVTVKAEVSYREIAASDNMTEKDTKDFWTNLFEKMEESDKEYNTDYLDRYYQTPKDGERGEWEGERGESKYISNLELEENSQLAEKMKQYDIDGIEYKNCEPDFSKCSEGTVEIDNMTENRYDYRDENGVMKEGNFSQADKKLADQFNAEKKKEKDNWTPEDVKQYRHDNKLSWHERCDTKTMDLVPTEIHSKYGHSGGCAECKARDSVGGIFDE